MTTPPSTPYCPQTYSPPTYSPPLPPTHPYHPGGAPAPSAPQAEFTAFGRRRWFTCEICLRVFNKKFLLTQHALSTHPTESTLLRCQELKCNYVCRSRTTLNKHVAKQHAPKTIRCPHCPEAFSMHWSLNEHISQMHTFYRYNFYTISITIIWRRGLIFFSNFLFYFLEFNSVRDVCVCLFF